MLQDLNDALIFAKVVEQGSFISAAKQLRLGKTTVSRKVQDLERRLGARLLNRTTRNLSLTEAGAVYYDYCNRIVRDLGEAESAVHQLEESPRGWLRVTAPFTMCTEFTSTLVRDFRKLHPAVRIELVLSNERLDLVANQIDVVKEEIRLNVLNRPYGGFPWILLPPVLYQTFPNAHNGYGSFVDLETCAVTIDNTAVADDDMRDAATDCFPVPELFRQFAGREDVTLIPHIGGRYADSVGFHDPRLERFADPELCQVVQHAAVHPSASADGDPNRSADQAEQTPGQQADRRSDRTLVARLFDRHLSVGVSGNNGLCVEIDAAFILQLLKS